MAVDERMTEDGYIPAAGSMAASSKRRAAGGTVTPGPGAPDRPTQRRM